MGPGQQCIAASVALTALAFIVVLLRCVARFLIGKNAGPDDYLIIAALAASAVFTSLVVTQEKHGLGSTMATVTPSNLVILLKAFYTSIVFGNLSLTFTKISILFQYLRFFSEQSFRRACYCYMAVVIAYCLAAVFGSLFACNPVAFNWDHSIKGGKCVNLLAFWFSLSAINIVTDLAIITLPIPVLKTLHLPRVQKWILLLVFTVGGFGCIISILRFHSLFNLSTSKDATKDNAPAAAWSSAELNVGIVCACMPTIKPIISRLFPGVLQTQNSKPVLSLKDVTKSGHISYATNSSVGYLEDPSSALTELKIKR